MRKDIKALPSAADLHALLSYDQETGALRWRMKKPSTRSNICWNNKCGGKAAGTVGAKGYISIGIRSEGKPTYYLAQRIVWKMMTGAEPAEFVDHKDGDRQNLKWGNLREATNAENIQNSKRRSDNKSGVKGVHWDSWHGKWKAVITANKKSIQLGRFKSVGDAEMAVLAARSRLHGEFARSV